MNDGQGAQVPVRYQAGSGTLIVMRGTRILLGPSLTASADAVHDALATGTNPMAVLSGILADDGDHAVAVVGVTRSTTTFIIRGTALRLRIETPDTTIETLPPLKNGWHGGASSNITGWRIHLEPGPATTPSYQLANGTAPAREIWSGTPAQIPHDSNPATTKPTPRHTKNTPADTTQPQHHTTLPTDPSTPTTTRTTTPHGRHAQPQNAETINAENTPEPSRSRPRRGRRARLDTPENTPEAAHSNELPNDTNPPAGQQPSAQQALAKHAPADPLPPQERNEPKTRAEEDLDTTIHEPRPSTLLPKTQQPHPAHAEPPAKQQASAQEETPAEHTPAAPFPPPTHSTARAHVEEEDLDATIHEPPPSAVAPRTQQFLPAHTEAPTGTPAPEEDLDLTLPDAPSPVQPNTLPPQQLPTPGIHPPQAQHVAADPFTPQLSSNQGHLTSLDRTIIIGRNPSASRAPDPSSAQLMQVSSPNEEISRSHCAISYDAGNILVWDLDSANGTTVLRAGTFPEALMPMRPVTLGRGDVVDLGDGARLWIS